jgi:hypothetical protein
VSYTTTLDDHPLANGTTTGARRSPGSLRPLPPGALAHLDWRQAVGAVALLAGVVAVFIGWFGVSGTLDPGKQIPYVVSGGIGGAALIAVGMTLFLSLEHARDRVALEDVLSRLDTLERRLEQMADSSPRSSNGTRKSRAATERTEQ